MPNYTILLIDYEPRSIERFRDPLVGAGYAVEIATDGLSGIAAFHRLNPDMVLVEAMIPKKHGFEVCQELKRSPLGRRTPIIITTGVYKGRKYRTQALHIYGCDEYIEKPIAPEQLLEIVGRFLGPAGSASSVNTGTQASSPSQGSGSPKFQVHEATDARATPPLEPAPQEQPRTTPKAQDYSDDGEAEIMARLDEILPTLATTPSVVMALELPADAIENDPLAQIRAELNAELGALLIGFPPEVESESMPEPPLTTIPSDHAVPPSVIEALPVPVVDLDARTELPISAPTVVLPQRSRRRVSAWVWALVLIAASALLYFFFMSASGDARRSDASPPAPPPRRLVEPTAATTPDSAPVTVTVPVPALVAVPAPVPETLKPAVESRKPALITSKPQPPLKKNVVHPTPPATAPGLVATAPSGPPVSGAPLPTSLDDDPAGVEIVSESVTAIPATTIAPGVLVPIDEADVLPVSVSRTPPVYSEQAKRQRLGGTVVMNVLVNERGTVDQVVLVAGVPGADVNDSVLRAAKAWTYRPAEKRGVPVKVWRSEQVTIDP